MYRQKRLVNHNLEVFNILPTECTGVKCISFSQVGLQIENYTLHSRTLETMTLQIMNIRVISWKTGTADNFFVMEFFH